MTYASLFCANLTRNPVRTVLTGICLIIAFLLFGLLQPIGEMFRKGPDTALAPRLLVTPRHSIADMLPVSYMDRIAQMEGVVEAAHLTWFGGTYIDPANFFPQYAVTPSEYLAVFQEIQLPANQREAFISNRQAAIVDRETADRFSWQVGDRIPLIPNIWHNLDAGPWEFELVGIFDSGEKSEIENTGFYFGYEYFDRYRAFGNGTVGSYAVRTENPDQTTALAKRIDSSFENSAAETKTLSESEYALSFARQIGDVGLIATAILAAVFFTILLLASNTIAQTTRERIPELAVLKILGFSSATMLRMILAESVLLTVTAAAIGLLSAQLLLAQIDTLVPQLSQLGTIRVSLDVALLGLAIALFIGLIVGLPPALKAMRLSIVDALRV